MSFQVNIYLFNKKNGKFFPKKISQRQPDLGFRNEYFYMFL